MAVVNPKSSKSPKVSEIYAPPIRQKGSPISALVNRKNVVQSGFFFRLYFGSKWHLQGRPEPAFSFVSIPYLHR